MAGEIKQLTFASGVSTTAPSGTTPMTDPMTTRGDIIYRDASAPARLAKGTNGQRLTIGANDPAWGWDTIHTVSSADYTVLDTDGYHHIHVTTGASDRTITLPTASANSGRKIEIRKVDSGAGDVIVDGEGAETIDGATTYTMSNQYESLTLICDGTEWFILRTLRGQLKGTNTNDSAAAGYVGEVVTASLSFGSKTSLTTLTGKNVATLSIPSAGHWQITGALGFQASSTTTIEYLIGSVSTTPNTTPGTGALGVPVSGQYRGQLNQNGTAVNSGSTHVVIPPFTYKTSAADTLYLVAEANFGTSTLEAYGFIEAVRVR